MGNIISKKKSKLNSVKRSKTLKPEPTSPKTVTRRASFDETKAVDLKRDDFTKLISDTKQAEVKHASPPTSAPAPQIPQVKETINDVVTSVINTATEVKLADSKEKIMEIKEEIKTTVEEIKQETNVVIENIKQTKDDILESISVETSEELKPDVNVIASELVENILDKQTIEEVVHEQVTDQVDIVRTSLAEVESEKIEVEIKELISEEEAKVKPILDLPTNEVPDIINTDLIKVESSTHNEEPTEHANKHEEEIKNEAELKVDQKSESLPVNPEPECPVVLPVEDMPTVVDEEVEDLKEIENLKLDVEVEKSPEVVADESSKPVVETADPVEDEKQSKQTESEDKTEETDTTTKSDASKSKKKRNRKKNKNGNNNTGAPADDVNGERKDSVPSETGDEEKVIQETSKQIVEDILNFVDFKKEINTAINEHKKTLEVSEIDQFWSEFDKDNIDDSINLGLDRLLKDESEEGLRQQLKEQIMSIYNSHAQHA